MEKLKCLMQMVMIFHLWERGDLAIMKKVSRVMSAMIIIIIMSCSLSCNLMKRYTKEDIIGLWMTDDTETALYISEDMIDIYTRVGSFEDETDKKYTLMWSGSAEFPSDEFASYQWESTCDRERLQAEFGTDYVESYDTFSLSFNGDCVICTFAYNMGGTKDKQYRFYKSAVDNPHIVAESEYAERCRQNKTSLVDLEVGDLSVLVGEDGSSYFAVEISNPNPYKINSPYICIMFNGNKVYDECLPQYLNAQSTIVYVGNLGSDYDYSLGDAAFVSCTAEFNYYNVVYDSDESEVEVVESQLSMNDEGNVDAIKIDYLIKIKGFYHAFYVVFYDSDDRIVDVGYSQLPYSAEETYVEISLASELSDFDHYMIYVG